MTQLNLTNNEDTDTTLGSARIGTERIGSPYSTINMSAVEKM